MQMMAENRVNIDCETFQNDMTTFKSKDDVLTLLVHLGYLAYDGKNGQVFIPNSEIRSEFERAVKKSDWQEEKDLQILYLCPKRILINQQW